MSAPTQPSSDTQVSSEERTTDSQGRVWSDSYRRWIDPDDLSVIQRLQRERDASMKLLRDWLCASDNFDIDVWLRKVRNLLEDGVVP